jgi:CubicO group peptidase (beta-lactamase class C family)
MNKKKKTKMIRIFLALGTLISLYFVPWPILQASLTPLPKTVQEQVNKANDYGFDGIIVYVDQANSIPKFYTSGFHNTEAKIPAKSDALFKIASISKLYTAVAITKLVAKQKLSLDKSFADYFPELDGRIENINQITIRMMVQHRSGIPNYTDTKNYWVQPKETDNERLDLVLDLPANFKPDSDYEYSNTNYLLLSMLIEKVTGEPKFQYIRENILGPLNLKNTYGSVQDVDIKRVMSGYYVGYDKDLKTDDNGVMLATAEDLGIFLRALNDGSLLTKKEQQLYASIYEFEHTGLIPGYQSLAKYDRDTDTVLIQFTNTVDFEGYHWGMSEIMLRRVKKIIKSNLDK